MAGDVFFADVYGGQLLISEPGEYPRCGPLIDKVKSSVYLVGGERER